MQNWLGWLMQASELREQLSPVSHTATLPCQSDSNSPQLVCGCVLVPACNSNCTLCLGPKLPARSHGHSACCCASFVELLVVPWLVPIDLPHMYSCGLLIMRNLYAGLPTRSMISKGPSCLAMNFLDPATDRNKPRGDRKASTQVGKTNY